MTVGASGMTKEQVLAVMGDKGFGDSVQSHLSAKSFPGPAVKSH